jgi:hypothetical protein
LDGQAEGRKSLSLDRCAVHVHNEVDRGQRTRTRMSLDEGARTCMSMDESVRLGAAAGSCSCSPRPSTCRQSAQQQQRRQRLSVRQPLAAARCSCRRHTVSQKASC